MRKSQLKYSLFFKINPSLAPPYGRREGNLRGGLEKGKYILHSAKYSIPLVRNQIKTNLYNNTFCSIKLNSFFLLLCFSFVIKSQTRIKDVGMWLSAGSVYSISKKQDIRVMGRVRIYENISRLNSYYVDIGYGYKVSLWLKISFHYAFNPSITQQNYFRNLHQYYARLDFKKFINKYFTFHNRIIFQHTTHRFITDIQDNGYKPYYRTDLRERVGLSYNISSSENIFFHNEWMYTLSAVPVELRRNRLYVGYEKDINNGLNIKIYSIIQSSFHKRKSPNTDHLIFGMDINFKLN